ncbi:LPS assembly lipoprotein LptE [Pseudooceanicola sp.]|uniref:LPS assembly lipoprotein LptE n=1 Tax=Pseudooceanicola sp. TaxID=1914328 RepID=UPI00262CBBD8|nr:LPS assembly lipoprotein LptE [Pseudooceanicola sp.]MDF1855714.1 hypothetical protein [Pseudooceanicola sp.]
MWSPERRKFLMFGAAAALAACGFEPVYAPGGGGSRLIGRVRPADPQTTEDYIFVREVETRLGRAPEGGLVLAYATKVAEERMAISTSNITTRFNVIGTITYQLKDAASSVVLNKGKVDSFTSYSTTGSTVATQAARRDARERLMVILANLVIVRLEAVAVDLPI